MRTKFRKLRARPGINVKSVVVKYLAIVFPTGKVRQIVFTDNHSEFFVGVLLLKMNERMNGVTRFGKVKLYIGYLKLVIVVDGGANHVIAIEFMQQPLRG